MTELDPKPFVFNDRGIEHRLDLIPKEWATPPNHNPYEFNPRPEYEQDESKYL